MLEVRIRPLKSMGEIAEVKEEKRRTTDTATVLGQADDDSFFNGITNEHPK